MTEQPRICDYGDSTYRQDFWEGQGRDYEDAVERRVLRRLLPARGHRLLEIGAGFGRMTPEYKMYSQVVLLDYSLEQLQYARRQFGDVGYLYVAADAYRMPFQSDVFDGATMIRVIHHIEDVPTVLAQVRKILSGGGKFILEYANKRHLKSMLRHALGRNNWNPFTLEPIEFLELNFNFHPDYMGAQVSQVGFDVQQVIPVSWFRLAVLKRTLPTALLAGMDALLQRTAWAVSPSVFLDLELDGSAGEQLHLGLDNRLEIFSCPQSHTMVRQEGDALISETGIRWGIDGGVYDFRQPLDG